MVKYCSVFGCNLSSINGQGISLFKFPKDKGLRKTWTVKTRRAKFTPTAYSYICSNHFRSEDYEQKKTRKILKPDAVPSIFSWNAQSNPRRTLSRQFMPDSSEETDSASESEADGNTVASQTDIVKHASFGLEFLKSHTNKSLIKFYTGFQNIIVFDNVLDIIMPGRDRSNIKYYDTRLKSSFKSGSEIFDSDISDDNSVLKENEGAQSSSNPRVSTCHKLSVEDEFLLVLIRLRLGLFYEDLATRFSIFIATVQRIFYSWINLMYLRLGSIKCFPHRNIIMSVMKSEFKAQYPNTMIIIDCTEIRVQTPSSLQSQSETFSNYKSTNTMKGLIGVDSRGGIMFVSQLYTGSISDKEICQRSGFYNLLSRKVEVGELCRGDAVMADKGFTISNELESCGLVLNIPPFLHQSPQLTEDEVITTHTIARHRIHVERAIRKIRCFHIFDRKIPVNMLGIINQIWLVCCLLSNFHDPIIS